MQEPTNRSGHTACHNTDNPFGACGSVVDKVNTNDCGLGKSYVSIANDFFVYASLSEVFVMVIVVLICIAYVLLLFVKPFPALWNVLLELSLFFHVRPRPPAALVGIADRYGAR